MPRVSDFGKEAAMELKHLKHPEGDGRVTEHDLWRTLIQNTNSKFFWKDMNRRFLGASKGFLDYYGFESEDRILGKTDEDMGWHVDPVPFRDDERRVLEDGMTQVCRHGTCIIRGNVRHIVATKMPIRDEEGDIIGLIGYFEDVTQDFEERQRLQTLGNTDPLTGLTNRNGLIRAAYDFVRSYRKNNVDFIACYLDIDHFKQANLAYGHAFGDSLLKRVSERILRVVGADSVVSSIGGDEFVILHQLPDTGNKPSISNTALKLQNKLRESLSGVYMIDGHSMPISVSVGFAAFSETGTIEDLIESAYAAMKEEK